jgi:hypothetical protein
MIDEPSGTRIPFMKARLPELEFPRNVFLLYFYALNQVALATDTDFCLQFSST